MKRDPTVHDILDEMLPIIDETLARKHVALLERPMKATVLFIHHCIVKIEGEDKNEFYDRPWFIAFLNYAFNWYKARYGKSFDNSKYLQAAVFINNHPFLMEFPYYKIIDEGHLETVTVQYLSGYKSEHEDWKKYIQRPPSFRHFSKAGKAEIERMSINTIERLRNVFHNLSAAEFENHEVRAMKESIRPHLFLGAKLLVENIASGTSLNQALWEFQMASEKTLKALLYQQRGYYPTTHDLRALLAQSDNSSSQALQSFVDKFPSSKNVINARYEALSVLNYENVREIYSGLLDFILELTNAMNKRYLMHNMRMYLRRQRFAGTTLGKRARTKSAGDKGTRSRKVRG